MEKELEQFVQEILAEINREMEEAFGKGAYERWKAPMYMGQMEEPDGYGCLVGACGDSMEIFLKFEAERVKEARYVSRGCGSSSVCGSFAAEIALGKSPKEILGITGTEIVEKMGFIPDQDKHLADLAAETLKAAARDYEARKKQMRGA